MINRKTFLNKFNLDNTELKKEVSHLISNWHIIGKYPLPIGGINYDAVNSLTKAVIFWINLFNSETIGFRNNNSNFLFHKILSNAITKNEVIDYIVILCPSYKKGSNTKGFAKIPGNTTIRSFANLKRMEENTKSLGIKCTTQVFFCDLAIENYQCLDKKDWDDFEKIIQADAEIAKKYNFDFKTLTEFEPKLIDSVGRNGKKVDLKNLDINLKIFERIVCRDKQFYFKTFGYSEKESYERTLIQAQSYIIQSHCLRERFKNPVIIYSSNNYERGWLYNGKDSNLTPAIIYPKKDENNAPTPTIPDWYK